MEKTKNNKPWWSSKTKWAALLIGVGPVFASVGGFLNGSMEFMPSLMQLSASLGVVFGILGFRDLPFINRIK